MAGVTTSYQTGVHGSRPANGAGCILYSCTTHNTIDRDDGTTWTSYASLGGGLTGTAAPGLTLSTTNGAGAATTAVATDATIAAFDATTPAAVGTAATGSAGKAARRDHVHATGAGTPTTQALGDSAATGSGPAAAMTDHKHAMPTAAITTSGLTQATGKLLGRSTAGTGAIEAITVGTNLTLSGGTLDASGGGSGVDLAGDTGDTPTAIDDITIVGAGGISVDVNDDTGGAATITIDGSGVSGGGGSALCPELVQSVFSGTTALTITVTAAASGHSFFLFSDYFNSGGASAVSCTNTTWTKLKAVTSGGSATYEIWVGVVAGGSSGTTITVTTTSGFRSHTCLEITDTLTGTVGATSSGSGAINNPHGELTGGTAGRVCAFFFGPDNTGQYMDMLPSQPSVGRFSSIVVGGVCYVPSSGYVAWDGDAGNHAANAIGWAMAECT